MAWVLCLYVIHNPRLDQININSISLYGSSMKLNILYSHIKLKQLKKKKLFIAFRILLSQQHRFSISRFEVMK